MLVGINLQVSPELNRVLEEIADDTGSTRTGVIRQTFALMKVAHDGKREGRHLKPPPKPAAPWAG